MESASVRPVLEKLKSSKDFALFVRRFLLMPDLGRCGEVEDEKRSDSLDDFPRVVGARGKGVKKRASWRERVEPRFD